MKSKTQELIERMFFTYFNPDTGGIFVYIEEDDTLYLTKDGTPETCLLSISMTDDKNLMLIFFHHGSWNREDWEEYGIYRKYENRVFTNQGRSEIPIEVFQDKLMDVYNEHFK